MKEMKFTGQSSQPPLPLYHSTIGTEAIPIDYSAPLNRPLFLFTGRAAFSSDCSKMNLSHIVSDKYTSPEETKLKVAKKLTDFNGGNFCFTNAHGEVLFKLEQKKVFLKELTVLRDAQDCPVASIHKKGMSFHDTYQVYEGMSSKELFTLKDKFLNDNKREEYVIQLEGDTEPRFEVKGDFVRRAYSIVHSGKDIIADVAKSFSISSFFTGKNQYAVHVQPHVDQAFIAVVVTIMEAVHNEIKEDKGDGDKSSDDED
ncbi:hypothetical protein R1flu_000137 [Riccia fluitans]|uniref:Uncharacterized protein n=1 Tax=Riccia fluitans TaxID=41844 RepID=A0ABD1XZL2_9MARC